ncbi:hypothetical protein EKO27_g6251 [Xylaria grammica]|uniref:SET domain-containing protein n=1 Tax=Xylaria grammica TaxID=363999 RepID=A0A439D330_9PEZI|nr:hypothetical protein EKO27_g6251 [Xylaria grammica]
MLILPEGLTLQGTSAAPRGRGIVATRVFRPGERLSIALGARFGSSFSITAREGGGHKAECKVFKRVRAEGHDFLPTPVRALVQGLLRPEMIAEVQGHVGGFRRASGKLWADTELQAMAALHYLGRETNARSLAEAIEVSCKLQVNSFNRLDEDVGQTGLFMNPHLAMVNHSCIPNAFVQFISRQAVLHAYREINKDEEVEISYIAPDVENLQDYQESSLGTNESLGATVEKIFPLFSNSLVGLNESDKQKQLCQGWTACKPFLDSHTPAHAVEPLPSVLLDATVYFGEQGNFTSALSICCFLATQVDPYKAAAPFAPQRVKGLLMIAKLLSNTAPADPHPSLSSIKTLTLGKSLWGGISKVLGKMDQATVCQVLLELVVYYAPAAHSKEWALFRAAKDLLDDIEALQDREMEDALVKAFLRNPNGAEERLFFEQVVLGPIRELSAFCFDVMDNEFGSKP